MSVGPGPGPGYVTWTQIYLSAGNSVEPKYQLDPDEIQSQEMDGQGTLKPKLGDNKVYCVSWHTFAIKSNPLILRKTTRNVLADISGINPKVLINIDISIFWDLFRKYLEFWNLSISKYKKYKFRCEVGAKRLLPYKKSDKG